MGGRRTTVTASWAIQKYGYFLNEYEKKEILKYRDVKYIFLIENYSFNRYSGLESVPKK